jgi:hypothetical protein
LHGFLDLRGFPKTRESAFCGVVADGTDARLVRSLKDAAQNLKADFAVVAPKVGGASAADGSFIEGDFQLAGGPSVLFETVFGLDSGSRGAWRRQQIGRLSLVLYFGTG